LSGCGNIFKGRNGDFSEGVLCLLPALDHHIQEAYTELGVKIARCFTFQLAICFRAAPFFIFGEKFREGETWHPRKVARRAWSAEIHP
jgi:hypothetical protein